MKIKFGIHLDGTAWSHEQASLGEVQLGPAGLLGYLETLKGLSGPVVHPAVRINQYMQRMEAIDQSGKWFNKSFNADSWSTARQMLAWRDELVEAGWKGEGIENASPRLRALAEIENTELPLEKGQSDRLRLVVKELKDTASISISDIYLQEGFKLLPPVWKDIFTLLRDKGVNIHDPEAVKNVKNTSSNLKIIQSVSAGNINKDQIKKADDSLLLLKASDDWEAADNLAIWLSAKDKENNDVAIICGPDTDILDHTLQRYGLPRTGSSEISKWRMSLQVLPLVIANAWKPVDIYALAELLSLPLAPIPAYASRHLIKAITNEPGTGGKEWYKALDSIKEEFKNTGTSKKTGEQFAEELDLLLSKNRYNPETGIPEDKLQERCQWVIEWLAWRTDKDPFLVEAVSHCREMQKLAEGKGVIPRVAVERMLDSVIGIGEKNPYWFEQAAPWQVLKHPGQITSPCKTIIWWNFTDTVDSHSTFWSAAECEELLKNNIELENPRIVRKRETLSWERPLKYAEENFLMIYPEKRFGEEIYPHPLWDEIRNLALNSQSGRDEDEVLSCLVRECRALQKDGLWELADRTTVLNKVEEESVKPLTDQYLISEGISIEPSSMSYSQMSTIIACPMKWLLQYHGKLRTAEINDLPTGNQMIGNLCHLIIQELYKDPGHKWIPQKAEERAGELYDAFVPSVASELLHEGRELDNMRHKTAVKTAVRDLITAIAKLGLTVEKSEEKIEASLNGVQFTGYLDLLLRDKAGNPFVIDLKWSGYSRYKKEEVEKGEALQLASYSWLLKSAHKVSAVDSGYFMLAQGELLSDSHLLKDEALSSEYTSDQIWKMGVKSLKENLLSIKNGVIEAGGVKVRLLCESEGEKEDKIMDELKNECNSKGMLYQKPVCGFCDFIVLCSMAGGKS